MSVEGRRSEVILLDDRRVELLIQPKLFAGDLFDIVASHFNLKEKEYFGLAFLDETGQYSWLNLDKRVLEHEYAKKHTHDKLILHFLVKYFVESITQLNDTASVELFYLQAKSLVANEVIQVDCETVFQLAALVLQVTNGDYNDNDSTIQATVKSYLKKLQLIPSYVLKENPSFTICVEKVSGQYKNLKGLTRGEAIVKYMSIIEKQPTYGVHFYEIKDKAGIPWWLGLSYKGISQFDYNDRRVPRRNFLWKQLENLYFREKKFSIEVRDPKRVVHTLSSINLYENAIEESSETFDDLSTAISDPTTQVSVSRRTFGPGNVTVYVWFASNAALTKCIWSMAIAQHQFYIDKRNLNKNQKQTGKTLDKIAAELNQSTNKLTSTRSSNFQLLNRSISSNSLPALRFEDSINQIENLKVEKQKEMYESLKIKKEALEEALQKKLTELKSLCLKEGELTGQLPPETPLAPGEEVPVIRRRVGTSFTLNDKLLLKPKTKEEEILSRLELEYEIQSKIVSAAAKLVDESVTKRSVRRQRRQEHQQALAKLKDIQSKLVSVKKQIQAANFQRNKKQPSFEDLSEDNISHSTDESQEKFTEFNSSEFGFNDNHSIHNMNYYQNTAIRRDGVSNPSASLSLPPTPNKFNNNHFNMRSLSPTITSFVPITMRARILHRPRSASAKYERSAENEYKNYSHEEHNDVFVHQNLDDTSSVGSSSSGTAKSVIQIHEKQSQGLILQSPYVNKYESSVNVEGSNLYSVPNRRTSIALKSQDDALLRTSGNPNSRVLSNIIENSQINEQSNLARSNSLESTRRKTLISTNENGDKLAHHHHYQNHHPSFRSNRSSTSKTPPPYHSKIDISQRPLPSPPIQSNNGSNNSDNSIIQPNYENREIFEKIKHGNQAQIYTSIPDDQVDHQTETVSYYNIQGIDKSVDQSKIMQSVGPKFDNPESQFENQVANQSLPQKAKAKPWTESSLDVVLSSKATYSIIQKTPNKQHLHHHHHHHHIPLHSRPPLSSNLLKATNEHTQEQMIQKQEEVTKFDAKEKENNFTEPTINAISSNTTNNSALSSTKSTSFQGSSSKTAIPFAIPIAPPLTGVEVEVVSVGHIQPYWEEEKPFELSDFYKYSSKHRKQQQILNKNNSKDSSDSAISMGSSDGTSQTISQSESSVSLNETFKVPNIGSLHDEIINELAWYDDQESHRNATLV